MKKALFILFIIIGLKASSANTWLDNYDTSWYNDIDREFYISSPSELSGVAFLSLQGNTFLGKTINLEADISLGGREWIAILNFEGSLDGNFHSITGLNFTYFDSTSNFSLISELGESGRVENLMIASSSYSGNWSSCAAFVYENHGTINRCISYMDINASYSDINELGPFRNVGGIAGENYGIIKNSLNYGNISAVMSPNNRVTDAYAGGICGKNYGVILNSQNYGQIYSSVGLDPKYWNGIAGPYPSCNSSGIANNMEAGVINNSINRGNVTAEIQKVNSSNPQDKSGNSYGGAISSTVSNVINCYYSSSAKIDAYNISSEGLTLNTSQLTNQNFNFTNLLNENNLSLMAYEPDFWANSESYLDNAPFLINGFNVKGEASPLSPDSEKISFYPKPLISNVIENAGFAYKPIGADNFIKQYCENFELNLYNLEPGAVYVYYPFIGLNNGEIIDLPQQTFETSSFSITTLAPKNITPVSAVLQGNFLTGNESLSSRGFLWRKVGEDNFSQITLSSNSLEVEYELADLSPAISYEYMGFGIIKGSGESIYGNSIVFTTSPIIFIIDDSEYYPNEINIVGEINLPAYNGKISINYKNENSNSYLKEELDCVNSKFSYRIENLSPQNSYQVFFTIEYKGKIYNSDIFNLNASSIGVVTEQPEISNIITFHGKLNALPAMGKVGFEFRKVTEPDLIPSKIIYSDNLSQYFYATTTDVVNNEEYKVRAFYSDNETTVYGSWVLFIPRDVSGGIEEINMEDDQDVEYYDLNGSRIENPKKGNIYIMKSKRLKESKKVIYQ